MGEESIVGDFEEVVGEERLELREEQVQMVKRKECAKKEMFYRRWILWRS